MAEDPRTLEQYTEENVQGGTGERDDDKMDALAELDPKDLADQQSETLPEREEMSLINANLVAPVNAAVALNVASDDSIAYANAEQNVEVDQSN